MNSGCVWQEDEDKEEPSPELTVRLVTRPEDFPQNITSSIKHYKDMVLRTFEVSVYISLIEPHVHICLPSLPHEGTQKPLRGEGVKRKHFQGRFFIFFLPFFFWPFFSGQFSWNAQSNKCLRFCINLKQWYYSIGQYRWMSFVLWSFLDIGLHGWSRPTETNRNRWKWETKSVIQGNQLTLWWRWRWRRQLL
jgi:hypothetical protein